LQFNDHLYYNCIATLSTNETFKLEANWIHNSGLDMWQGWSCDTGHNRIFINAESDVYGGECLNDKLGNLNTGWDLLPGPTVCNKSRCTGCTDDLMATKSKSEKL
jgi:hypothetical protein